MKYVVFSLVAVAFVFVGMGLLYDEEPMHERPEQTSNDVIVIAAPSIHNEYYKEVFQDIVNFDVAYANAVLGNDDIRILIDEDTKPYFEGRVPENILVTANVEDIWMRDFTTVNPHAPLQFRYTPASFDGDQSEADFVQDSFTKFMDSHGMTFETTDYFIDGGNIVDNYEGRVITTTRFLEDNELTKEEGIEALKELLGATEVAIIPPDDETLAHSDGMVTFAEPDTIIVNQYDEPFRTEVLEELEQAFPGIKIVEIEAAFEDELWADSTIGSACGINVNAVVTEHFIYMPHFGDENSDVALETIKANTSKTVISVPAQNVCKMGGSVRCLTWQQSGEYAKQIVEML